VSVVDGRELKRRRRRKRKTNNAKPLSNPTCIASKTRSSEFRCPSKISSRKTASPNRSKHQSQVRTRETRGAPPQFFCICGPP